jgi:hypothetical protein
MNKKQTIRKLGSIEAKPTKQTKQTTQPTQPTPKKQENKKLDLEYNQESDDNIEKFSDGNDDGELREIDLEPKN